MPGWLRQATANQSRSLGPFVDTDGVPVTGLTIANTDVKLVLNGAASTNKNSGGGTHRVNGVYGLTFDATDTASLGELEVSVLVSGALVCFDKWQIIAASIYDSLFATPLGVGTADSGSTTTLVDTERTEADSNYWRGSTIVFTSGNVAGQARTVTGFNAGTDTLTFYPATTQAIGAGITYELWPGAAAVNLIEATPVTAIQTGLATATDLATVDTVVDAIKAKTDNLPADPAGQSSILAAIDGVQSDTNNIQTRLPAALVGGNMASSIEAVNGTAVQGDGSSGNKWRP